MALACVKWYLTEKLTHKVRVNKVHLPNREDGKVL